MSQAIIVPVRPVPGEQWTVKGLENIQKKKKKREKTKISHVERKRIQKNTARKSETTSQSQ